MPIDAFVRVSFQTSVAASQATNRALVGHAQDARGSGPFVRVGTALFRCEAAGSHEVGLSLERLGGALREHSEVIDFVSVTVIRTE
jgi:hypothetical protein